MSLAARAFRPMVCLALIAGAVWAVLNSTVLRAAEASAVAFWSRPLLGDVRSNSTYYSLPFNGNGMISLNVTIECAVVLLVVPLAAAALILLLFTKAGTLRVLAAFLVSVILVLVINQVRLAMIAWATQQWGIDGYEIAHRYLGSMLALFGIGVGFLIFLWTAFQSSGSLRTRRAHAAI